MISYCQITLTLHIAIQFLSICYLPYHIINYYRKKISLIKLSLYHVENQVNETNSAGLTVEVVGAAIEALLILFTFLSCCFVVTDCCRKNTGSMFHQEYHHLYVVTGGCTVERSPTETIKSFNHLIFSFTHW